MIIHQSCRRKRSAEPWKMGNLHRFKRSNDEYRCVVWRDGHRSKCTAGSADYPGAMAIGADSKALKNAIALGWKSSADDTSAALGLSAQAHADSIALGAYSMTDRPHSVSVGSKTALRQLTYLANGTMLTDAVNVRQFKGAV